MRSAARTDKAVIRPVFGFSEGTFSIARVSLAESLSTSIEPSSKAEKEPQSNLPCLVTRCSGW